MLQWPVGDTVGYGLAAGVTDPSHGQAASLWPSTGRLASLAGPSLAWSLPARLRGHDAPGDGHQGIFATIPGSQAPSQGTSWPADWVARLAWLPRA